MEKFSGEYPANWNEIATGVKESAGWRCVRCGHKHSPPSDPQPCDEHCDGDRHPGGLDDGRQRVLTIHHLDGDKSNSRPYNLLALCQVCHLRIQGKVVLDRPWVLEHSAWFKPYAAAWYAFRYLGETITLDKAAVRLEGLLSLERLM